MANASPQPPESTPAAVFAALGDRTRLGILARLSDGESRSIASLSTGTELTRQAVSKHLQVLQAAGLVSNIRVGRESRYAYRAEAVDDARAYLERVSAQWDAALGRLKRFVED